MGWTMDGARRNGRGRSSYCIAVPVNRRVSQLMRMLLAFRASPLFEIAPLVSAVASAFSSNFCFFRAFFFRLSCFCSSDNGGGRLFDSEKCVPYIGKYSFVYQREPSSVWLCSDKDLDAHFFVVSNNLSHCLGRSMLWTKVNKRDVIFVTTRSLGVIGGRHGGGTGRKGEDVDHGIHCGRK